MKKQLTGYISAIYTLDEEELAFIKNLWGALEEERSNTESTPEKVNDLISSLVGIRVLKLFYKVERRREEIAIIETPKDYNRYRLSFSPRLYLRYKNILKQMGISYYGYPYKEARSIPGHWLEECIQYSFYPNNAILLRGTDFPALGWYDDLWYEDHLSPGVCVDFDEFIDNQVLRKEVFNMDLHSTIHGMISEDFKERFKAEYQQLKIRSQKLRTMLNSMKDETINFNPKCDYDLLHEQLVYMQSYLGVLERRATIEGISLLWLNDGAPKKAS